MTRYLNIKTVYGTETIDELSRADFPSHKEYIKELNRLLSDYRLAGFTGCYISQRADKTWKNK